MTSNHRDDQGSPDPGINADPAATGADAGEFDQLRISCRLEVLPGGDPYARIKRAAQFGFQGVALPGRMKHLWLDGLTAGGGRSPALPLTSVSLGFEGTLVSPDEEVRRRCRDSLLGLFDVCAKLGIGLVNMPPVLREDHPGLTLAPGDQATLAEWDRRLVGELAAIADDAAARGVRLLLEPVNRYESDYLHTIAHAARLCREVGHPAIGFTADLFHMQLEELSPEEALWDGRQWLGLVHVAENTRVEPGPGLMDFLPPFSVLRASCYRGWVEIECRSLTGPADKVLPRSIKHLREYWDVADPLADQLFPD